MLSPSSIRSLLVIAALVLALAMVTGCRSSSRATLERQVTIIDPATGKTVYESRTLTRGETRGPSNANAPTTQAVTESGVVSSISGQHRPPEKPLDAYLIEQQGPWFYGAAVALGIGAVVAFWLRQPALGVGASVAAGSFAAAPSLLNSWVVIAAGAIALLIALAWAIARYAQARAVSVASSIEAAKHMRRVKEARATGDLQTAVNEAESADAALRVGKPKYAAASTGVV